VFPNPDEEDAAVIGVSTPTLHNEVTCTFVKALRDVVTDLKSYRDSPLLNLLRGTERAVKPEDETRIVEAVQQLNEDISSLEGIRQISRDIQGTLHGTVGHTYSPEIDIRSDLPEEFDRLLQGLALKVSDPSDKGYSGDIYELPRQQNSWAKFGSGRSPSV
jgi:putative ATP-dependent endonuclease of the OLD family